MLQNVLNAEDIRHFIQKGYVVIKEGFPKETAAEWAALCCHRLGIDPHDRATWHTDRVHMPGTKSVKVDEFAPKVWAAACQLCGGEDRVVSPWHWSDHFIVNLGERSDDPWMPAGPDCPGWHKDGDFFRHYLDSPEQGLLTLVLWTDVIHQGGPTYLAADSVSVIAKFMADHPEGVLPGGFDFRARVRECREFAEATGEAGDVYLIHPYALHAVSQNVARALRIITNPPITLREPMQFNRADGAYSPVEQAVLAGLGVESYAFEAKGPRERIVPERERKQAQMLAEEKARLAGQPAGG